MGNGEKPADVNRDEDGSCLAGGAIRMDSESSSQGKRKADNPQVKLPAKKRRSQDEDNLFLTSDWDGSVESFKVRNDLSQPDIFVDPELKWDGPVESFKVRNDLSQPDIFVDPKFVWDGPVESFKVRNDLSQPDIFVDPELKWDGPVESFKVRNDLSQDYKFMERCVGVKIRGPFQVLKSGCDMDCTDESEMICDSEGLNAAKGSNEMARELIFSWCESRKARCSGPFVIGSVKFNHFDLGTRGRQIPFGTRGRQIPFDAGSIAVIHSDTPMFILVVEKRSVAVDLYDVLVRRGYHCIIVATMRKSLELPTLELVYRLRKMSNLQVYALFDCSPRFQKIMLDLIIRNGLNLIWLGIQPFDVHKLLELVTHVEPMTDTEQILLAQYQGLLERALLAQYQGLLEAPMHYKCISEQLGLIMKNRKYNVPVKAFSTAILIDYYLPKLLIHYGVPGAD